MLPTGVHGDVAGGVVASAMQAWGYLNGIRILVVGDPVASHGLHSANNMATGSPWFTIRIGAAVFPVCRYGDLAACGHPLAASQDWFLIA